MKIITLREPFCIKKAAAGGRVVTRSWFDVTNVTLLEDADSEGLCVVGVIKGRVFKWFKDGSASHNKEYIGSARDLFIARDMQRVGDHLIPAGMLEAPPLGSEYYVPDLQHYSLTQAITWKGTVADSTVLQNGFAFSTYEDAQEAASILFGLEKVTTEHGGYKWQRRGV